eukprot:scaffold15065_cov140-Isochrysis_galbana.AAC.5
MPRVLAPSVFTMNGLSSRGGMWEYELYGGPARTTPNDAHLSTATPGTCLHTRHSPTGHQHRFRGHSCKEAASAISLMACLH